jgi:large subunit ribosomal protein L22
MEVIAKSSVRVAPRKVRLVADAVRKLTLIGALTDLPLVKNRGASPLLKTLKSAVSNATNNNNLKQESLSIKSILVTEAPSYKRFHPSTRGRVHPYKRRGSNITVILTDNNSEVKKPKSELKINTQIEKEDK